MLLVLLAIISLLATAHTGWMVPGKVASLTRVGFYAKFLAFFCSVKVGPSQKSSRMWIIIWVHCLTNLLV